MIQFQCAHCKHRLKAPMKAVGKSAKCSKCGSKIRVPSPKPRAVTGEQPPRQKRSAEASGTAASPQKIDAKPASRPASNRSKSKPIETTQKAPKSKNSDAKAQILELIEGQLEGKVPRNPLNLPYQFCLSLVALMMVLMPLLYCGLIASACYGMFWYWTEILPGLMKNLPRGRAAALAIMAYAAPLIGGGIMILFMVKPIFFSFVLPRDRRQRSLKRASEPALFELVERICKATRSPIPKRIDINNDVNASASLRRGFLSLLGKDLVLTIGAPLIAGMNTRQLTGVLAHEFGHFAQGGGMKATYLILSINRWFARVVYQRDQLDEMLDEGIGESDFRISLVLLFAKLFVLLSRAILWCFLMVTHAISCMMTRQMEFDADRYEAYVAGSDYFEETFRRLVELTAGEQVMHGVVATALQNEMLLADLPGITAEHADSVSRKERKRIETLSEVGASGFFSTHPPTEKRVKAAKKFNAEGLFQLEIPARKLFKNFDAICTGVSADFYRNHLGILVDQSKLVRLDAISNSEEQSVT